MLSRKAMLAASCFMLGVGASLPGQAQVASEGMEDISAWGVRYLSTSEPDFPSNLWTGSDGELLLALLASLDTANLTTAERKLLRRVVLSPAQPMTGPNADAILTERARLMLELGEANAAAALAPRLEPGALGLEAEALAIDLELASGQEATACGRLDRPVSDSVYWLQLRAVCAVLRENFAGAEIAIEVASAAGLDDPWFLQAVFAASGETPNPPDAKYESGLSIALSLKAGLDTSNLDIRDTRPDLAAALARREDIALPLRVSFGELAYLRGLISSETWREILEAQFEDPEFTPRSARDELLALLFDPLAPTADKMAYVAEALVNETYYPAYERTANLLAADIAGFAKSEEARPYAAVFARASFANGDVEDVRAWLDLLDPPPAPSEPETEPEDDADGPGEDALTEDLSETTENEAAPLEDSEPAGTDETESGPLSLRGPMRLTAVETPDSSTEDDAAEDQETVTVLDPADETVAPEITEDGVTIDGVTLPIDTDSENAEIEPEAPEPFIRVLLETLVLFAEDKPKERDSSEITSRLIAAAETEDEMSRATVLLNLLPAFGVKLDADARAFLISQPVPGDPVDPHIMAAIEAATETYAFAEAALMLLTQLRDDPQGVAAPDLARFASVLREMDAPDIAAALAREASGFWIVENSAIIPE